METYTFDKAHDEFGKKVLKAIQHIFPYVKHRLYVLVVKGYIPKKMYRTNGIIDDAIIELYSLYEGKLETENEVRLKLFALVDNRINELHDKEAFHKDTMSISEILEEELKSLEEKFDFDANNDPIMHEELDDISYHQEAIKNTTVLYAGAEDNLVESLDIPITFDKLPETKRKALNRIYYWLPTETSNILDLLTFGKLSYDEIAIIKSTEVYNIKKTVESLSLMFRVNLL